MPDEALNTYDAVIQTISRGHEWIRDVFGEKHLPKMAWRIDPFGSTSTMSKLYKESGLEYSVTARTPYKIINQLKKEQKLEFMWKLSDGSDFFNHIMDISYCIQNPFTEWSKQTLDERMEDFTKEIEKRRVGYKNNMLLLPLGCDFSWDDTHNETWAIVDPVMEAVQSRMGDKYKIHYSLLSDYLNVASKANDLPQTNQEFLPYADKEQSYWTGYYTSYPLLKKEARRAESMLRTCNILYYLSRDTKLYKNIEDLRKIVSDVSHHDGITGTSTRHVVQDYYLPNLRKSIDDALKNVADSIRTISEYVVDQQPLDLSKSDTFSVVAFNNLSWKRFALISVNVVNYQSGSAVVVNSDNVIIQSQTDKDGTVTFADYIPGLSHSSYSVRFRSKEPFDFTVNQKGNFFIANDLVKLSFCKGENGTGLCSVRKRYGDDRDYPVKHENYYYKGPNYPRYSGAYVFRADGPGKLIPQLEGDAVVTRNAICSHVVINYSEYITHKYTLCKGSQYVDIETTINGNKLPEGYEIVSRFSTDIFNNNTLFCDKNNLETRKFESDEKDNIASNFLPMTTSCYIREDQPVGYQFTVQSTQSYAVASIVNKTIEVMIHRTCLFDDGLGVYQPLLDRTSYTSKTRFRLDKTSPNDEKTVAFASDVIEFNNPVLVTTGKDQRLYKSSDIVSLPKNIHLLSLEVVHDRNTTKPYYQRQEYLVMRLQHIGEGDDKISVNINAFLKSIHSRIVEEVTLSSSYVISPAPSGNEICFQLQGTDKNIPPCQSHDDLTKWN
ncbi:lysosomal alpha-mannosidase [Acrasis kona]|uniref:Lysosomal alpha-mannosidase n=1 Tax=Acrasis kona TaxID=1008807 RepID=A0AAW2YSN6_9EUKA